MVSELSRESHIPSKSGQVHSIEEAPENAGCPTKEVFHSRIIPPWVELQTL